MISALDPAHSPNAPSTSTLTGRQVLGVVTRPDPVRRRHRLEPAAAAECDFCMVGPRELAAIAGFPRDYVSVGSRRDVALATGNAVTPRMAQHVFERVVAALP